MSQQKINITDLNKNWPTFINRILEGDEIILTETDKPIAVVSPLKPEKSSLQSLFPARKKSVEEGEEIFETNSEWWIG